MEQRKFILIKPYKCDYGTLKEGDEIIMFRNVMYYNGGMVMGGYQSLLRNLVMNDNLRNEYLKEVRIIQNKI